jgi:hypothetical protein
MVAVTFHVRCGSEPLRASSSLKRWSTVTRTDRIVRVTFDPAAAGIDQATFDSVQNNNSNQP